MRRKTVKKTSMYKLQAEKKMFEKFLSRLPLCHIVQQCPDFQNVHLTS